MGGLDIFTTGELVAMALLLLQLILVAVLLRDKRLWRIRQNSKHPSAARAQLEEQSRVDRAQTSQGSSPPSSISHRKHFPRFIRSSRDAQALFKEHQQELEAQLAQQQYRGRGCSGVQTEVPVEPRLLGGRESPQCLGAELPRPDTDSAREEVKCKDKEQCSTDYLTLQRRRSMMMTRLLPRVVVIVNPRVLESSSSSSMELEYSSTTTGWFLVKLRARFRGYWAAWQTRFVQHRWFRRHRRTQRRKRM